jgi:hypothetical protein
METLERIGVYKPPVDGALKGTFENVLFRPTRNFGHCDPKAKENMSPVIPEMFGATQSMQNAQVMTTTNGVACYVCVCVCVYSTSKGEETLATPAYLGRLALVPLPLGAAVTKIKDATLHHPALMEGQYTRLHPHFQHAML